MNGHQTNDAEEMTLKKGDTILILNEESKRKNWMEGCLDSDRSKIGLFPVHYVKFLDEEQDQRVFATIRYSAINDHHATDGEELSFKRDDLIIKLTDDYIERMEGLWVYGCLDSDRNRRGLFPVHCVNFPRCRAKDDYKAYYSSFLSFKKGDIILILDARSKYSAWMIGCLNADKTKVGHFYRYKVEFL